MKKNIIHMLYHIFVVVLSAGIALSLPVTIRYIAQRILMYWSVVENEDLFLVATEIAAAIFLIIFINTIIRGWRSRKISRMAKDAGLAGVTRATALLERRRLKKLKEGQGF